MRKQQLNLDSITYLKHSLEMKRKTKKKTGSKSRNTVRERETLYVATHWFSTWQTKDAASTDGCRLSLKEKMHSVQGVKSSVESESHSKKLLNWQTLRKMKFKNTGSHHTLTYLLTQSLAHTVNTQSDFFSNLEDSNTLHLTTLRREFKVSRTRARRKKCVLLLHFRFIFHRK